MAVWLHGGLLVSRDLPATPTRAGAVGVSPGSREGVAAGPIRTREFDQPVIEKIYFNNSLCVMGEASAGRTADD
jgi:hypothetical protein